MFGICSNRRLPGWTHVFLATTLATTVTGFLFPVNDFTPALGVGILSLLIVIVALVALYQRKLRSTWRWIYIVGAVIALYFNSFVLVVQSFLKIPALHGLAPNGTEPPFALTQGVVLMFFLVMGFRAVKQFHPVV